MSAKTPEAAPRLPIVGVIGSGDTAHEDLSLDLGRRLAGWGVHLLTGGGGGVMAAVSQAFYKTRPRKGLVLAILPARAMGSSHAKRRTYFNPWVEVPIITHLPFSGSRGQDPLSRNHIVVLSSNAMIALPGGEGTASEMQLALKYGRPIIAYGVEEKRLAGLGARIPLAMGAKTLESFLYETLSLAAKEINNVETD